MKLQGGRVGRSTRVCGRVVALALVGAAVALALGLGRGPAATDPGAIAPEAWPARLAVPAHDGARGVIRTVDAPGGLVGVRTGGFSLAPFPTEADLADARALLPGLDQADPLKVDFEHEGSFIFRARRQAVTKTPAAPGASEKPGDPTAAPAGAPDAKTAASPLRFVFVSGTPGAGEGAPLRIERTWFTLYEAKGVEPRGLALLMPGMFGTPEPVLELFTKSLRERGWAVVRMMSQPSRFTQRIVFKVDLGDLPSAARSMGRELDQRVAECAYAAQAAMAFAAEQRPALAHLPRIAIGMSGGAMTLPSVLAREPDAYAAAVIIAGGCDFFAINEESNYKTLIEAIDFAWSPGQPTDEQRRELDKLYLQETRLDSYHAAAALRGKAMLMIHGDHDGAVPARLGDLLWERLGKPERWVETAGHEEVFMKLPGQVDRIMDWVGEKAAAHPEVAGRAPAAKPAPAPR